MKTSKTDLSARLEQIKKRNANKICFDCGEKGTTYAAMNFGTFVCSRCAGLLRELNFKVKGTGVSIFKEKEIDLLDTVGNENARKIWLAKWDDERDKMPNPKNSDEVKRHLVDKYKDKRYYKKGKKKKEEESSDSEEEEKKTKKKKKKEESSDSEESDSEKEKKKKKKKSKKKKEESSSESESSEESDSEEEKKKKKKKNKKKKEESSTDEDNNTKNNEKGLHKISIKKPSEVPKTGGYTNPQPITNNNTAPDNNALGEFEFVDETPSKPQPQPNPPQSNDPWSSIWGPTSTQTPQTSTQNVNQFPSFDFTQQPQPQIQPQAPPQPTQQDKLRQLEDSLNALNIQQSNPRPMMPNQMNPMMMGNQMNPMMMPNQMMTPQQQQMMMYMMMQKMMQNPNAMGMNPMMGNPMMMQNQMGTQRPPMQQNNPQSGNNNPFNFL